MLAIDAANELHVSVQGIRARWREHGGGCWCRDQTPGTTCRFAGLRRNLELLDLLQTLAQPWLVLAFWDGRSSGTEHCVENAQKRGIPADVVLF